MIRSGVDIGWAEIDLSGAEDSEVAFGQLLERDRAHRFDMETAPLIRFMLVRIGPDTARLVVTNHHNPARRLVHPAVASRPAHSLRNRR